MRGPWVKRVLTRRAGFLKVSSTTSSLSERRGDPLPFVSRSQTRPDSSDAGPEPTSRNAPFSSSTREARASGSSTPAPQGKPRKTGLSEIERKRAQKTIALRYRGIMDAHLNRPENRPEPNPFGEPSKYSDSDDE